MVNKQDRYDHLPCMCRLGTAVRRNGFTIVLIVALGKPYASATNGSASSEKTPAEFNSDFRSGLSYDHRAPERFRLDAAGLDLLRKELAESTPHVRSNVVRLLKELGLAQDVPSPGKSSLVRNPAIIRTLGGYERRRREYLRLSSDTQH